MCVVKVVEPLNQGSPGMPNGHMTFLCVMTVPNFLLSVSNNHDVPHVLYIQEVSIHLTQCSPLRLKYHSIFNFW